MLRAVRVAGIVLAAGRASRMGVPKVTLPLAGRPIVRWAAEALASAGCAPLVAVVGPDTPDLAPALAGLGASLAFNPDARSGMSTSLQAGLRALPDGVGAAVVALGDQPGIGPQVVSLLLRRHAKGRPAIVVPSYRGLRGNPVLLDRAVWAELMALAGDAGARDVILRDPSRVVSVDLDRDAPPDVDTPEMYERLLREGFGPP